MALAWAFFTLNIGSWTRHTVQKYMGLCACPVVRECFVSEGMSLYTSLHSLHRTGF